MLWKAATGRTMAPLNSSVTLSGARVVAIGAACVRHWVPLFDQLDVDLVLSHHAVGYQRGRAAGSGVTYVVAGGMLKKADDLVRKIKLKF